MAAGWSATLGPVKEGSVELIPYDCDPGVAWTDALHDWSEDAGDDPQHFGDDLWSSSSSNDGFEDTEECVPDCPLCAKDRGKPQATKRSGASRLKS